jgi:hypothetical protein
LTENDLYRRKGDMRSRVIVGPEVQWMEGHSVKGGVMDHCLATENYQILHENNLRKCRQWVQGTRSGFSWLFAGAWGVEELQCCSWLHLLS